MDISKISCGKDAPYNINVVIEISANSDPVKYEFDKDSGAILVDRFVGTGMRYPCNYGFIPHTIAGDGDPVDVLVITPYPLMAGSVVQCRPLGMLNMTDDGGSDAKILAVPIDKVCLMTADIKTIEQVPEFLKNQIQHFFEQYKALEKGKWVKIEGWQGMKEAEAEIINGINNNK